MTFKKGQSGNPKGRAPGKLTEVGQLRDAIKRVQKKKRKTLFSHAVERAYESDQVLIALLKKVIPDLKYVESDNKHEVGQKTMAMVVEAIHGLKNGKGKKKP